MPLCVLKNSKSGLGIFLFGLTLCIFACKCAELMNKLIDFQKGLTYPYYKDKGGKPSLKKNDEKGKERLLVAI